jgi:hypothetical protein
MRTSTPITRFMLLLVLALFPAWPTTSSDAADQVQGAMVLAPTETLGTVASGTTEDTLKACLGRIPAMATAGQRMLAEQSCKGDETTRKLMSLAPRF